MDEMIFLRDLFSAVMLGILISLPFISLLWILEKRMKHAQSTPNAAELRVRLPLPVALFVLSYVIVAVGFANSLSDPSITIGIVAAVCLLLASGTLSFFKPFHSVESRQSWTGWIIGGSAMAVGAVTFSVGTALQYVDQSLTDYGWPMVWAGTAVMAFAGIVELYKFWSERREVGQAAEPSSVSV